MNIRHVCSCNGFFVNLDVSRIEAEPIRGADEYDDDEPSVEHCRDFRIITTSGKILELRCSAGSKQALTVRPRRRSAEQPDEENESWLIPQVYTGVSMHELEMQDES